MALTPIEAKIAELKDRSVKLGDALSSELPLFDGGTIYYYPTVGAFLC